MNNNAIAVLEKTEILTIEGREFKKSNGESVVLECSFSENEIGEKTIEMHVASIKALVGSKVENVLSIGKELAALKKAYRKEYTKVCEEDLPFSKGKAEDYLRVYKRFGMHNHVILESGLDTSSLIECSMKKYSDEILEKLIKNLKEGLSPNYTSISKFLGVYSFTERNVKVTDKNLMKKVAKKMTELKELINSLSEAALEEIDCDVKYLFNIIQAKKNAKNDSTL